MNSYIQNRIKKQIYIVSSLVWVTKLLLAAIGLVFPALVLVYNFYLVNDPMA